MVLYSCQLGVIFLVRFFKWLPIDFQYFSEPQDSIQLSSSWGFTNATLATYFHNQACLKECSLSLISLAFGFLKQGLAAGCRELISLVPPNVRGTGSPVTGEPVARHFRTVVVLHTNMD